MRQHLPGRLGLEGFAGISEDRHLILSRLRLHLFRDVDYNILEPCPLKERNPRARA